MINGQLRGNIPPSILTLVANPVPSLCYIYRCAAPSYYALCNLGNKYPAADTSFAAVTKMTVLRYCLGLREAVTWPSENSNHLIWQLSPLVMRYSYFMHWGWAWRESCSIQLLFGAGTSKQHNGPPIGGQQEKLVSMQGHSCKHQIVPILQFKL